MKKGLLLTLALAAAMTVQAQEPQEMQGPDLTGDMTPAERPVVGAQTPGLDTGNANWFVNMDYAGFDFELPAGVVVDKGSSFVAKYPDGTFGLSMSNESKTGCNQKVAYELCRRQATELKLEDPVVRKESFGRCNGAIATGTLEGNQFSILILPYDDQQVTTVMIATPTRTDWANHFLQSLKR